MKAKNILVSSAKLFCSAALIIGAALPFASCGKKGTDSDKTPKNSVIIDGVVKPIVRVDVSKVNLLNGDYFIELFLSEEANDCVTIKGGIDFYDGKTIDLTQPQDASARSTLEIFMDMGGDRLFHASLSSVGGLAFETGTFMVKRIDEGSNFKISLKDGKITDELADGQQHTIEIVFDGEVNISVPENKVLLDSALYPIFGSSISENALKNGDYHIEFFLDISKTLSLYINVNEALHNGKVIDLTKSERAHDGYTPEIQLTKSGVILFTGTLDPMFSEMVFSSGTLYVKRDNDNNFVIKLENGVIMTSNPEYGDGLTHTIEINFNRKLSTK